MKKINITTPENIEIEVVLAEVLSRSAAAMIDLFIQGVIIFLLGCGFYKVAWDLMDEDADLFVGFLIGGFLILSVLIIYGYHMFFEIKWNGQTIGKKVMHLRVIRNNGGPVTVKQIVIRNLFRIVLDYTGLGILLIFLSKTNKRLGDMVAGTMVIIEEKQERPVSLDEFLEMSDEVRSCLTQEEYNILREYFSRKQTMTHCEELRLEMRSYFKERLVKLGIFENNEKFIDQI